jgi:cysteinyl-tRNA synthetase
MALVAELVKSDVAAGAKAATLVAWDRVLGLDLERREGARSLPPGAEELIARREAARAARDFATSDALREELKALGVEVTDRPIKR